MMKSLLLAALMVVSTPVFAQDATTVYGANGLNVYGETREQADRLEDLARQQHKDYQPIVVVCPLAMPHWQCSTAKGFHKSVKKGQLASNSLTCGQYAQQMAASLYGHLEDGEYMKVMCPRIKGTVEETGEGDM